MLAYCGLVCSSCPIRLATLDMDESHKLDLKELIVPQCSKIYGIILNPIDISDCNGCKANTGRLFSGCWNCEIQKYAC
jgi:hypothetical protein